jgi:hypothetical protein
MADDADRDDDQQGQAPADEGDRGQQGPGKDTKHGDDPGGQERGDQFTEAAADPLAGTWGGTGGRAAEGQAYRTWVKTVRSSGAAAFVGGGHIGVMNISTTADRGARGGQAPGPVAPQIIEQVTSRYVPVAAYGALVMQLRNTRLLVLRGAPGTGRATTGLRLLAEVTDEVARFPPETDLSSLDEGDLQQGAGYLIKLAVAAGPPPPTAVHVDRLRDRLAARECYLVVIAPYDIRHKDAFHGCIADCALPDPKQVFDRVAANEIRSQPGLETVLRQASADLKPDAARTPSEMTWLVARIASAPAGELAAEQLARMGAEALARYVSSWFEPLAGLPASSGADDQVRLAAFRIALAVFNETPFDLVAEAGENLTTRILTTRSPRRSPGRPVFAGHREDYVANSRASLIPGTVKFLDSSAPATFATYDDERLPLAVLSRAWSLHNLRGPVMAWLQALSSDRRPFVRMRAALAIGLLLSWDFSYTFHELIEPWAGSTGEESYRRWVAAVALDEASRNDDVLPVVREILEAWCRKGTYEQRWTGAMALGYDLGLRDPSKALKELRKVGCWEDGELAQAASWAVARIFALGAVDPVLTAASSWLRDDRIAVRELGLLVILRIADMKVSDLEDLEQTSQAADGRWRRLAGRGRWPLLVAISDEDPALRDRLADLVWQLPRSAPAQLPALEVLTKWMRAGEKDRSSVGPISRFLALLGDDQFDRARLLHLVGVLRRDRDEPLPPDIADRYVLAIEKNMHVMDKTG